MSYNVFIGEIPLIGHNREYVMSLQFIFTRDSFMPDSSDTLTESEARLRERFISNRYEAFFDIGSETAEAGESMSLGFLRTVNEHFT